MGRHLSDVVKQKVVDLYLKDFKIFEIQILIEEDGYEITRRGISGIIGKWKIHHTLGNLPSKHLRTPKDVTLEILDFIDSSMETNDELTAKKLQESIENQFAVVFSATKVKRLRRSLGWLSSGTKYCQLVKEVNRIKRLQFSEKCLELEDNFDDVLWSDECCVQLDWNGRISFHRWWEPAKLKGKPKHPYKVCS